MSNSKNPFKNSPWTKGNNEYTSVVNDLLNVDVESLKTLDDAGVKELGKRSDDASTQTKRMRSAATHVRKLFHSTVSQNKILQGLIREGLSSIKSIRSQEAKTAKTAAKLKGQIEAIDHRTSKGIELAEYGTGKEKQHIDSQFTLAKQQIDQRYASLTEYVNETHGDSVNRIQERTQKRIQQSKRPWE
jgi:hypothetical protein